MNFNFDICDYGGMTPLHFAIHNKQAEVAKFLILEADVNVNVADMVSTKRIKKEMYND